MLECNSRKKNFSLLTKCNCKSNYTLFNQIRQWNFNFSIILILINSLSHLSKCNNTFYRHKYRLCAWKVCIFQCKWGWGWCREFDEHWKFIVRFYLIIVMGCWGLWYEWVRKKENQLYYIDLHCTKFPFKPPISI